MILLLHALILTSRDHETPQGATRAAIERTRPQKRNQKSEVKARKVSGPGWYLSTFSHAFFHRRAARPKYMQLSGRQIFL